MSLINSKFPRNSINPIQSMVNGKVVERIKVKKKRKAFARFARSAIRYSVSRIALKLACLKSMD